MLRSALALGACGVVLLDGSVELANPKVLRASMGAAFRLPVVTMSAVAFLEWAEANGVPLLSLQSWCAHAERWRARRDHRPLLSGPASRGAQ